MPINVNNPEADALTRRFAAIAGIGTPEAIERRHLVETPRETAARLRAQHGITLSDSAREPLPREVYDALQGSRCDP
ncbi:type II toxin-antitoxin system VapB family antitoxin [Methylobacterium sp. A52T]